MLLKQRLFAFVELGRFLSEHLEEKHPASSYANLHREFKDLIEKVALHNPWFTKKNVLKSISGIAAMLHPDSLETWLNRYDIPEKNPYPKQIGVVMAGNIPMVGFHDLLCVVMTGHMINAKLSADDNLLLPFLVKVLDTFAPGIGQLVNFETNLIKGAHAYIATGSDNSARYFEYYFGTYPHIIRRNRTSVAVIDGAETDEELAGLADDIFSYFGMGCRNVTQLFIPNDFPIDRLFDAFSTYHYITEHHKYMNNYDYRKSIALLNKTAHFDNGFLLLFESDALFSPVAAINFKHYENLQVVQDWLDLKQSNIQCVTGHGHIPFGKAQMPKVWDYADGVDTMQFLLSLNSN